MWQSHNTKGGSEATMIKLEKLGPNLTIVKFDTRRIYFSYETPIAFTNRADQIFLRQNEWGKTTGKHLNFLDDKTQPRLSSEDFEHAIYKNFPSISSLS